MSAERFYCPWGDFIVCWEVLLSVGRFAACMQFASCGQLWFLRAAGMPAVMVWEKFLYAEERIGDFSDTFRVKIWLEEIMDKRDEELSGFEVRQGGAAYAVGVFIIAFSAMLQILEINYHKEPGTLSKIQD